MPLLASANSSRNRFFSLCGSLFYLTMGTCICAATIPRSLFLQKVGEFVLLIKKERTALCFQAFSAIKDLPFKKYTAAAFVFFYLSRGIAGNSSYFVDKYNVGEEKEEKEFRDFPKEIDEYYVQIGTIKFSSSGGKITSFACSDVFAKYAKDNFTILTLQKNSLIVHLSMEEERFPSQQEIYKIVSFFNNTTYSNNCFFILQKGKKEIPLETAASIKKFCYFFSSLCILPQFLYGFTKVLQLQKRGIISYKFMGLAILAIACFKKAVSGFLEFFCSNDEAIKKNASSLVVQFRHKNIVQDTISLDMRLEWVFFSAIDIKDGLERAINFTNADVVGWLVK